MYVSYDFYIRAFGSIIPETEFFKSEAKAEAVISCLTYINGDIFAVPEVVPVKMAVCAAAETVYLLDKQANEMGATIKSESNDGYSVTYVTETTDGQTAEQLLRRKVLEAVRIYLLPTGWLSRSVRGGCRHVCADCNHAL